MDEESTTYSNLVYTYCAKCGTKAWINKNHEAHSANLGTDFIEIGGIFVAQEVITSNEEHCLLEQIDTREPWCASQEGRAKQDYGPKVNFLQRKVSIGKFNGFPDFSVDLFKSLQERYPKQLGDVTPVELCFLEYTPNRKSYIRPHFDDKWIWGDRLVTVNLLSETFLRLTREYNTPPYQIVIPMPRRSLVVVQGEARYSWLHSINSYDIKSRRVALTWREFGEEILNERQHAKFVQEAFAIANNSLLNPKHQQQKQQQEPFASEPK